MSNREQVQDNLNTFDQPNPLNRDEQAVIRRVSEMMNSRVNNGCTGCNYCMPCPKGVNIPFNFRIWNTYGVYRNKDAVTWQWKHEIAEEQKAQHCVSCGLCEKACPQKIEIRRDLNRLQKELDTLVTSCSR
jgi:predicted aldo/keto reductase-like oxidoreductase